MSSMPRFANPAAGFYRAAGCDGVGGRMVVFPAAMGGIPWPLVMVVDRGRDANVADAAVRESGRGFTPPGRVRRGGGRMVVFPQAMGGIPWPLVMAVDRERNANVVDAAVRESGRGFPPRGCVRRGGGRMVIFPAAMGGIPWPLVAIMISRTMPLAFSAIYIIN